MVSRYVCPHMWHVPCDMSWSWYWVWGAGGAAQLPPGAAICCPSPAAAENTEVEKNIWMRWRKNIWMEINIQLKGEPRCKADPRQGGGCSVFSVEGDCCGVTAATLVTSCTWDTWPRGQGTSRVSGCVWCVCIQCVAVVSFVVWLDQVWCRIIVAHTCIITAHLYCPALLGPALQLLLHLH